MYKIFLFFIFYSFGAFAETLFYTPAEAQMQSEKPYTISHKSYIEGIVGNSTTYSGNNLTPFNRFQRARVNLNSTIEFEDTEKQHKAFLELRLGTNSNEDRSSIIYLNQGYIEMQNAQNQPLRTKISFGLQQTAANSLAVNSSTTMKNSQGINGNWYRFAQMPVVNTNGGYNPTFILQNSSLIAQGFGDSTFLYSQNNNTLNYVQPSPNWSSTNVGLGFAIQRINGFKTAFTYQPFGNSGNFGMQGNNGFDRRGIPIQTQGNNMFMKDITSLAINYLNEWRGLSLNTTIAMENANFTYNESVVPIERNRIEQYTFGMNISYVGFTLGGSYSYAGNSLLLKQNIGQINSYAVSNNSQVQSITTLAGLQNIASTTNLLEYKSAYNYDVGLSYAFLRYQVGIAYNKSRFMNNEASATVFSLSEDLKAINGVKLTSMFEAGMYSFNSASYFTQNAGNISIQTPQVMRGYFGYIGLRASL